jgi:hypothetical protein
VLIWLSIIATIALFYPIHFYQSDEQDGPKSGRESLDQGLGRGSQALDMGKTV